MDKVPCVVAGAGVVGLAVARSISRGGISTLVLEKNGMFGAENSSRNSEVLHAGLYYAPGSHKANFCRDGKLQLVSYMKERHVPHRICGKLIVACSPQEVPTLQKIKANGEQNGLNDLRMLTEKEAHSIEPSVVCHAAMISPSTGILDSHTLMLNYVADIEACDSGVIFNCSIDRVTRRKASRSGAGQPQEFEVHTSQGTILCDYFINAAGMHAPYLASNMDFYPSSAIPPVYFAKGNYFKLTGVSSHNAPFHRLVYPIPAAGGLGVHATLDLQGQVKFGPNVEWLRYRPQGKAGQEDHSPFPGDPYRFPPGASPPGDFSVSPYTYHSSGGKGSGGGSEVSRGRGNAGGSAGGSGGGTGGLNSDGAMEAESTVEVFCREISRYWPGVRPDLLVPDYAGIRPKLCGPTPSPGGSPPAASAPSSNSDTPAAAPASVVETPSQQQQYSMPVSADFAIVDHRVHKIPGLVNLFGIESPGLTASMAIGDHVRDLLLRQR